MKSNDLLDLDGLIYKMARTFTKNQSLIEDLYQQGMIGVLKAQKNFNPYQGIDFKVYAKIYISQSRRHRKNWWKFGTSNVNWKKL